MEKGKIGQLVLAETNWCACFGQKGKFIHKKEEWEAWFPVARSIHLTVSPKNWLCILYWPWPQSISPRKIDSVALLSCRQCGKWIKTQIKWSCPFPPWMQ